MRPLVQNRVSRCATINWGAKIRTWNFLINSHGTLIDCLRNSGEFSANFA